MKKILIVFLLISMIFAATACSSISQSDDVTLSSEGISITLPKDFAVGRLDLSDNPDVITSFSNTDDTILISVIKELKSEIDVNSAHDYLQLHCEYMPEDVINNNVIMDTEGNYVLPEDDGVEYYEYTDFDLLSDSFKFFNTAYESDDAFWLVQFCCNADDYDSNKADFIKWAKTVSFY